MPTPRKKGFPWILAAGILLLVIYPLSIGPASWCYWHDYLNGKTLDIIYAPLEWCASLSPELDQLIRDYVSWWL